MKCIVLSRIDMTNNRFCTCVLGEDDKQYRVLMPSGRHPRYGDLVAGRERKLWIPGRVVYMKFKRVRIGKRPTHPEDSIIRPGSVRVTRQCLSNEELVERVASHTFASVGKLFPEITFAFYKGFYLSDQQTERSVGYVHPQRLLLFQERSGPQIKDKIRFTDGFGPAIKLPIKDPVILDKIALGQINYGREFKPCLVRLGLSHPIEVQGEKRAYLQLTHIID